MLLPPRNKFRQRYCFGLCTTLWLSLSPKSRIPQTVVPTLEDRECLKLSSAAHGQAIINLGRSADIGHCICCESRWLLQRCLVQSRHARTVDGDERRCSYGDRLWQVQAHRIRPTTSENLPCVEEHVELNGNGTAFLDELCLNGWADQTGFWNGSYRVHRPTPR